VVDPPSGPDVSEGESVRERQCGRCQLTFPGDPGLDPLAQLGVPEVPAAGFRTLPPGNSGVPAVPTIGPAVPPE